jgi:mono/diheme cytochrome c family protein
MKLVFVALAALFVLRALAGDKLPEGRGKPVFEKVCGTCHGPDVVTGMGHDKAGWKEIVDEMVDKGATASEKDRRAIIDYLVKAFPKKAS